SIETDNTGRVQAALVTVLRGYEAVRGQEDHAVEGVKFDVLPVPRVAVVAHEVVVLLEARVVVGREHLAVRVDVHAGSLGLYQQLFKVLQIMTADENGGVFSHSNVYCGDLRVTVGGGV